MVDSDKLRRAGILSTWLYIKSPEAGRPQRAFHQSDMVVLEALIIAIGNEYQNAKLIHGNAADFESCMNKILNDTALGSVLVRNLYASTLMTYFRWRQRRFLPEYNQKRAHLDWLWRFIEFTNEKESA